jgi:hypothetical protein
LGQAGHAFCTFRLFSFFCSGFWQNVGSFSTFGLIAIFGYFCSFLGSYELVRAKKVYCRFTDVPEQGRQPNVRSRDSTHHLRLPMSRVHYVHTAVLTTTA